MKYAKYAGMYVDIEIIGNMGCRPYVRVRVRVCVCVSVCVSENPPGKITEYTKYARMYVTIEIAWVVAPVCVCVCVCGCVCVFVFVCERERIWDRERAWERERGRERERERVSERGKGRVCLRFVQETWVIGCVVNTRSIGTNIA